MHSRFSLLLLDLSEVPEHASSPTFYLSKEGGERGRRPPLPEIVRSSYRRLQ